MKRLLITWILLLAGCVDEVPVETNPSIVDPLPITRLDTFMLGGSNCDAMRYDLGYTAPEYMGIPFDCVGGRKLTSTSPGDYYTPNQYDYIIINLGANDASNGVPVAQAVAKYQEYFDYDNAEVWCIIPYKDIGDGEQAFSEYRDAFRANCANVIDPKEWGILFQKDNVHYQTSQQDEVADILSAIVWSG